MTNDLQSEFDEDNDLSRLYHAYAQKGGVNSEIVYKHHTDGSKKTIARYGAKKSGFSIEHVVERIRDLVAYQKELEAHDVPMPPIEDIVLEHNVLDSHTVIVKTSPWTGKDVKKILQERDAIVDRDYIESLVRDMCTIIKPVCKARLQGWETKVGIDPRCTNFTVDSDGKMWFVDLFPARYRKEGVPIVEWPEPKTDLGVQLGYFKHFDVRGIILCKTAQLARIMPSLKDMFERVTFEEMCEVMSSEEQEEFTQEFKKAPWLCLRKAIQGKASGGELVSIIDGSLDNNIFGLNYNVYTLRETALELAFLNIISRDELEQFFKQSHFEDELHTSVLESLQKTLSDFVLRPSGSLK
jgi:hypothetical protein